jgi:hypothetical protein
LCINKKSWNSYDALGGASSSRAEAEVVLKNYLLPDLFRYEAGECRISSEIWQRKS